MYVINFDFCNYLRFMYLSRLKHLITNPQSPLILDSTFLADTKKLIKERIIPWDGLARADIISEDDAVHIKALERQSLENKNSTILSEIQLYTNTILHLLDKLEINSRDDALKNILVLINNLFFDLPHGEFFNSLLKLSEVDTSLPYQPFVKHLHNNDLIIKSLCLYNLTLLLTRANHDETKLKVDKDILIKIFDILSSDEFIGNMKDGHFQLIGIQLLQELLIVQPFKDVYRKHALSSNFKPIDKFISNQVKRPNSSNFQTFYHFLITVWILSFSPEINKVLVHVYPQLIGNLLSVAKDSIKLKIIRVSVSILKNFISLSCSNSEEFKTIKLVLFHDGLNSVKVLKERKFASNGSDEELSNDLNYMYEVLSDVVDNRLTSFDEYLTELENPKLISLASPTHKSERFWHDNAERFKESSFKLTKRIFQILATEKNNDTARIVMLNDLQYLIKILGDDMIEFINSENSGQYKLLIMDFLDDQNGNSELKYEALKTIQLLVGHRY